MCLVAGYFYYVSKNTPSGWKDVKIGMTPEEVEKVVPDRHTSLQGYDSQSISDRFSYWHVNFYYDQRNTVHKIERKYHCREFDWLSRTDVRSR